MNDHPSAYDFKNLSDDEKDKAYRRLMNNYEWEHRILEAFIVATKAYPS